MTKLQSFAAMVAEVLSPEKKVIKSEEISDIAGFSAQYWREDADGNIFEIVKEEASGRSWLFIIAPFGEQLFPPGEST